MDNNIKVVLEELQNNQNKYETIKDNIETAFHLISKIESRGLYNIETKSKRKGEKHIIKIMGNKIYISYFYNKDSGIIYYDHLNSKNEKVNIGKIDIDYNNSVFAEIGLVNSSVSRIRMSNELLECIHFNILKAVV